MKKIGIYKITSPTGRVYIGQSIDILRRISAYKRMSNCNKQPKLYNSLKKHGAKNHKYEILEECTIYDCSEKERYYQLKYNSVSNGLNCEYANDLNTKKEVSIETRNKMSKSRKGKKLSQEHKRKISLANKGKKKTIEHLEKLSKSKEGRMYGKNHHNSKIVLNTETGIFYESAKEASQYSGIKHSTMKARLNGYCVNNSSFIYA